MPGSCATVLVIWETILETMTRNGLLDMGLGLGGAYRDDGTDAAIKKAALDTAADGAQRATGAGLVAQPRIANRDDNIAAVILAVAVQRCHGQPGTRAIACLSPCADQRSRDARRRALVS